MTARLTAIPLDLRKLFLGVVLGLAMAACAPAVKAADMDCPSDGDMHFICGIQGAEDILQLGSSKWLITSGLGMRGAGGGLHLVDTDSKTAQVLYPGEHPTTKVDKATYPDCPGAPDPATFVAHGLSLTGGKDGDFRLYAINHAREAVEVFDVKLTADQPTIAWVGCVPMPPGTYTNSVAALPGGGFVATKMYDPTRPNAFAELRSGKISGLVYEWVPGNGFKVVPGSAMSGPNGIAVSSDGRWVYVAAFGSHDLVRMARDGSAPKRQAIPISFPPDNLRWDGAGKLTVAGVNPPGPKQCDGHPCPNGWTVLEWDPETMTTKTLLTEPATSPIGGVSGATEARGYLWIGSFNDNKIGYIAIK